jgi:hypothetical protein
MSEEAWKASTIRKAFDESDEDLSYSIVQELRLIEAEEIIESGRTDWLFRFMRRVESVEARDDDE